MMENTAASCKYATSKTSVWWDIDSCPVPADYDASLVGPSIHLALEKLGYGGPITITAVGKLKRTSPEVLRAISSTGIVVKYNVSGHESPLYELHRWMLSNPPPATVMFISSSSSLKRLSERLHLVQTKGYNMLVAHRYRSRCYVPRLGPQLVPSAKWRFKSLLIDDSDIDKLEAKRRILQEECSKTGESDSFACSLCYSAWQSLEEFTTHLEGLEHEVIEFRRRFNTDYFDSLTQVSLEKDLQDYTNFLNSGTAQYHRVKKVTTKMVKKTAALLAKKIQWEELKKKLEESGQLPSLIEYKQLKRYKISVVKFYQRVEPSPRYRMAEMMKLEHLEKMLDESRQLVCQEQKKQLERLKKRKKSKAKKMELLQLKKKLKQLTSQVQHEQEKPLESSRKRKFVNEEVADCSRPKKKAKKMRREQLKEKQFDQLTTSQVQHEQEKPLESSRNRKFVNEEVAESSQMEVRNRISI